MSNHLSASQRQIFSLQQRVAELEQMQKEYNALMNYIIVYVSVDKPDEFVIHSDELKRLDLCPIRSEISDDGKRMTLTRVSHHPNSNHKPRIIV